MQSIPQFPPSLPLNLFNKGDTDALEISFEISQIIPQNTLEIDLKDPAIPLKSLKGPDYEELLATTEACIKTLEEVEKAKEQILHLRSRKRDQIIGLISRPLEILKSQYLMIYDILRECPETEENILVIMQKYGNLGMYSIEYKAQKGLCLHTLTKCLEVSSKEILQELLYTLQKILKKRTKQRIGELQVSVAKLKVLSEFLPHAATMDQEDIFALNKEIFEASDFQDTVQVKSIASPKEIRESYKRLISSISLGISMVTRARSFRNPFARHFSTSLGIIYDSLISSNSDIQKRTNLFYSQPNGDVLFQVWNVLDDKTLTKLFKIVYPSIKHSRKVYIPKLYDAITLDIIQQSYEDRTINTISPLSLGPASLEELGPITKTSSSTYKDLRKKLGEKIPLRILSAETLPAMKNKSLPYIDEQEDRQWQDPGYSQDPKPKKPLKDRCFGFFHKAKEEKEIPKIPKALNQYFDGVVIHIHGGGFVAMSSSSHQSYTRQWAKQVGKAVLSVDYRLAPKFPYPTAIDDCWQAYNWILNDMEKSIGIKPRRIVLTGDSAGGNLALALTFLAIKNNVRVPNGLMLAYPALRVDVNSFTPSYLIALHDQILPHSVLKLIPGAYIPEGGKPKEDPLLSPLYASDELLKKLPPIRMMVGEKDPLHDDCWRLVAKLKKLEKDVKMTVYRDLAHGFLGYDMPGGLRMAKVCIREAGDMIKELLEK